MGKSLSEMTLQELWQLFPIRLTPYDARWKEWYKEEEKLVKKLLPHALRISHIGSTAVENIWAKPIVDILVELPENDSMEAAAKALTAGNYRVMSRSGSRISFNKGYTEEGFAEKVFHLHLRQYGDCDELYFRDFLREHPEAAKEYEALKLRLWKEFEHDRDGYTDAKERFVKHCTRIAKDLYTYR